MWLALLIAILLSGLTIFIDFRTKRDRIKKFHPYFSRVGFTGVYIAIALFLFIFFRNKMFYVLKIDDFNDWPRFVWCIVGSCTGFTLIASQFRFSQVLPYNPCILYYPPMLLVFSSLVYALLSIFPYTSGHIFYYLSFPLTFILAFLVDKFWKIIEEIIKRRAGG